MGEHSVVLCGGLVLCDTRGNPGSRVIYLTTAVFHILICVRLSPQKQFRRFVDSDFYSGF